jgi:N-acetylglucosamine kinase-like BadF-type ATPase
MERDDQNILMLLLFSQTTFLASETKVIINVSTTVIVVTVQTSSMVHTTSHSMGTWGYFLGDKAAGA